MKGAIFLLTGVLKKAMFPALFISTLLLGACGGGGGEGGKNTFDLLNDTDMTLISVEESLSTWTSVWDGSIAESISGSTVFDVSFDCPECVVKFIFRDSSSNIVECQLYLNKSSGDRIRMEFGGSGGSYTARAYINSVVVSSSDGGSTYGDVTFGGSVIGSAPATPTGLAAGSPTTSSLSVSWNAVSGATSYALYKSETAGGVYSMVVSQSGTSYVDSGLGENTTYYYKVTASNSYGESSQSSYVSGTTSVSGGSAPATPTGLTAGSPTTSSLSISWDSVSGATGYYLYRSTASGSGYTQIASQSGTTFSDTGLSSGTTYYYKVAAYNIYGTSSQSSYAYNSTTSGGTVPGTPTGLTAGSATSTSLSISWNTVSGATSYKLYRSTSSGSGYSVITSPAGTSYSDTGLSSSTTYYYKVSAVNGIGEGTLSAYASGTTTSGGGGTNYRTTKADVYDASHTKLSYITYSYVTGTNRISRLDTYSAAGVSQSYSIYTYDGNNRTQKLETFSAAGVSQGYTSYTYDGSSNNTKTTSYTAAGTETGHTDMTYSGSNCIESKMYTRSGGVDTLSTTTTNTYSGSLLSQAVSVMSMVAGSYTITTTTTTVNSYTGSQLNGSTATTVTSAIPALAGYPMTTVTYVVNSYDVNGNLAVILNQNASHATTSSIEYTWGTY